MLNLMAVMETMGTREQIIYTVLISLGILGFRYYKYKKIEVKMNGMYELGFLGTSAPFFMDLATTIVAFLPFLMMIATSLIVLRNKAHSIAQVVLFIVSVVVLIYFEIGVKVGGGFEMFTEESSVSHDYAHIVLIAHILVALFTMFIWAFTLITAKKHVRERKHPNMGKITLFGVILTSISGIWVYMLLFVH